MITFAVVLLANLAQDNELLNRELRVAVRDRDVGQVQMLVDKGAKLSAVYARDNVRGTDGEKFRLKILELLLDHGTEVNDGTLIIAAAGEGTVSMVRMLLDRGANAEANVSSFGPLYFAILQNRLEVVELLLDRGASPIKPCQGRHALRSNTYHYGIVTFPLQLASYRGRYDVVPILLKRGAEVNYQDLDGESALHTAALKSNNIETIRTLLFHGADRKLKTKLGETALDIATRKEDFGAMAALK